MTALGAAGALALTLVVLEGFAWGVSSLLRLFRGIS